MKWVLCLAILVATVTCLPAGNSNPPQEGQQSRGRIVFQDEFDYFDSSKWQHIITAWRGGNDEFQYYSNKQQNR